MLINTVTDKTKLMLIACRQKRSSLIDSDLKISFNSMQVKNSRNENILGVHVDHNFIWNIPKHLLSVKIHFLTNL